MAGQTDQINQNPSDNQPQKGSGLFSHISFHKRRRLVRVPQNEEEIERAQKLDYVVWTEEKLKVLPCT